MTVRFIDKSPVIYVTQCYNVIYTTYHRSNYVLWKKNREGKLNTSLDSCFVCPRAAKISHSRRWNLSRGQKNKWKNQDARDRRESEINPYFIQGKFAAACRSQHFPHTYLRAFSRDMYIHTQSFEQLRICVCVLYAYKHSCIYYRRKLLIR